MNKRNLIASEAQEQTALFSWAKYHQICKDYLIAIPNGGSRHPVEARNLKRQGVRAGVSDIFLAYPMNSHHGLWIELKSLRHTAKLTIAQQTWLTRMRNAGYVAVCVAGWEIAKHVIEIYLDGRTISIETEIMEAEKFHA